jgi:hemerythrin-like domain-containing protein
MEQRRRFLRTVAGLGSMALVSGTAVVRGDEKKKESEEEVSAAEDLMREHGVLNRVLLIYEAGLRRLRRKEEIGPEVFHTTAALVRKFVEDYHEKLEEQFIFPEFEKRKKLTDLVGVLRKQHEAGRGLTDVILREAAPDRFRKEDNRKRLVSAGRAFIRMYRPHEAREDTVLFPALHEILPTARIEALGEQFEEKEHRLFGEEGFEKVVDQVAAIEKQLGIYDLAQFTPKSGAK